jgi:hypothetical protein
VVPHGCPPSSLAHVDINRACATEYLRSDDFRLSQVHSVFVSDTVTETDLCQQPYIYCLHDTLRSKSAATITKSLFPLFSDAKLSVNGDIRVPLSDSANIDTKDATNFNFTKPWWNKEDTLIWRGFPDGIETESPCYSQKAHFVHILNGTSPQSATHLSDSAYIYMLRAAQLNELGLAELSPEQFHAWIRNHTDVAFTDLPLCENTSQGEACCDKLHAMFSVMPELTLAEQWSRVKFIGLLDGSLNDQGAFRKVLLSSSVPVRATLYRSWYDSRVVPWAHYIPIDNAFLGLYGILEFFFGIKTPELEITGNTTKQAVYLKDHDKLAQEIAKAGADWAARVLRREDMEIYVYRLLLEYGSILNE